ncbi:hypothetical protein [Polynucleobacter asymbioticus]|jgi:hypothetical protein|uniref:Uncharacterized protein n=1 Tax=Polynucleobacter asymbioticus TaxID=576611 RepID=A0AAC9IRE9_9BURK|nr:hypothetical protein [Polynucleobacter asymbioticus]APB99007.1 hypothetical protein A4F89_06545 [Polynucleobacter asymbioticus]APC01309.1 hypothetical protein AOC25_06645 [Polynucleobacter asymbioticus]
MKYLSSAGFAVMAILCLMLSIQLDRAKQEIIQLDESIARFEIHASQDSDMIEALKAALIKRSHSHKKVICLDYDYAS